MSLTNTRNRLRPSTVSCGIPYFRCLHDEHTPFTLTHCVLLRRNESNQRNACDERPHFDDLNLRPAIETRSYALLRYKKTDLTESPLSRASWHLFVRGASCATVESHGRNSDWWLYTSLVVNKYWRKGVHQLFHGMSNTRHEDDWSVIRQLSSVLLSSFAIENCCHDFPHNWNFGKVDGVV